MAVLLGQAAQPQSSPQAPAVDPSQMTLADRAAAMRKARSASDTSAPDTRGGHSPLSPEQRGAVRGDRYVNDFFHFQILLANEWEPLSSDRMQTSLAAARELEKETGIRGGSGSNRALWMAGSSGGIVILSMIKIPPDLPADPQQLAAGLKKISFAQMRTARDLQEPVVLGDAAHKFAAFRYTFNLHETDLVQSTQVVVIDGFMLNFAITGETEQVVTENLRALRSRLTWTNAQAADGPGPAGRPVRKDPFQPHR